MKRISAVVLALLLLCSCCLLSGCGKDKYSAYVKIDVKDFGEMIVGLRADKAPDTVENFLSLVDQGFYDGLTFHRIMTNFMIQGGDPTGTGYFGSGTTIKGEFAANGYKKNDLKHLRGTISMARGNDPDSASSQFFICQVDYPSLDGNYAAFGMVVKGIEVVDAICYNTPQGANGAVEPQWQPIINSITRCEKP